MALGCQSVHHLKYLNKYWMDQDAIRRLFSPEDDDDIHGALKMNCTNYCDP